MNRSKKGALSISAQLVLQLVTAICGFIIPKLMLESFGSELNGMVSSITQFIGIMALLESGFGAVAKAAFYKPLAAGDGVGISGVFNATESFFRRVAFIFLGYCVLLSFVFPFINASGFDYWFTLLLVLILGISSFAQYYFGISYTVLFNADQRGFFSAFLQAGTIVLNAALVAILLWLGAGIHVVKLVSALVFIVRPFVLNVYGRKKYRIDRSIPKDEKSLSQKWDNLGQSIALYVHTKTDYVVLTFFSSFKEVSVYSVYSLVTTSLSAVISSISTGFVSGLGNIYANKEKENFKRVFNLYVFVNGFIAFLFYTIALITIIPFVSVYTANLTDVNYIRPLFAVVLIAAELVYCIRLPYYYMITNAGHFKQIKKGAYVEAGINIVLSVILVNFIGILGLAIGTLAAMLFRTVEIILYCSKNITEQSPIKAILRVLLNTCGMLISVFVCRFIPIETDGFISWIFLAAVVGVVSLLIMLALNFIFYKEDMKFMLKKVKSVFRR